MKVLRLLDRKNYDKNYDVISKECVRAVIFDGSKIAVLKSLKRQEFKLPGGGIDYLETKHEALCREILEETGLVINKESIKEIGTLIEIKKDIFKDCIFRQEAHYYLCEVLDEIKERHLSKSEEFLEYELWWCQLEDVIKNNEELLKKIEDVSFIERETFMFKYLLENKYYLK